MPWDNMAGALVEFAEQFRKAWHFDIDEYICPCGVRKCAMSCHMAFTGNAPDMRSHPDFKIYFWIDLCCADDACLKNEGQYMEALPAYIAACHAIATDWVDEDWPISPTAKDHYYSPADDWRKAELLVAFAFTMQGNRIHLVPRDFDISSNPRANTALEGLTRPRRQWDPTIELWSLPRLSNATSENQTVMTFVEIARASQLFTCKANCVRSCDPGDLRSGTCSLNRWCFDNVCWLGQCCGICACVTTRNVDAGLDERPLVVSLWQADGPPLAAPEQAEMTRTSAATKVVAIGALLEDGTRPQLIGSGFVVDGTRRLLVSCAHVYHAAQRHTDRRFADFVAIGFSSGSGMPIEWRGRAVLLRLSQPPSRRRRRGSTSPCFR